MAPGIRAGRPSGIDDTGRALDEPSQADSQRWDTSPLSMASPVALTPVAIPMLAPIPSPLASFSQSDAWLLDLVNERASIGVRALFGTIQRVSLEQHGNSDLRQIMVAGAPPLLAPLSTDRETGFVVYLKRQKHYMAEEEQSHDLETSFELRYEWIGTDSHFIRL